jgi:hypothetical protein
MNFSKSNGRVLGLLQNSINNVFDQRIMTKTSADGEIHSSKLNPFKQNLKSIQAKFFKGSGSSDV